MNSLRSNKIRNITLRYSELNFQSWILKFRLRLQKPWSLEAPKSSKIFFLQFWQLFYSKKSTKIEKKTILRRSICATMQKQKKSWKNALKIVVFFTIRVSEFGASIFGVSNGPNISGFRIIRISGLQHWRYCWDLSCTS